MQISDNNENVKHALLTLKDINMNEQEQIAAIGRDLAIRDMNQMYQDGMNEGFKKGIKIGLTIGIKIGIKIGLKQAQRKLQLKWNEDRRQTILRCLAIGIDIPTIATIMNVSEDIIRKLPQE